MYFKNHNIGPWTKEIKLLTRRQFPGRGPAKPSHKTAATTHWVCQFSYCLCTTLAGFDLTTHSSAVTTRPRRHQVTYVQSDQIGRFFTSGSILEHCKNSPHSWLIISTVKIMHWFWRKICCAKYWAMFSQTHLVTLPMYLFALKNWGLTIRGNLFVRNVFEVRNSSKQ
jgi:hypothetical protein